MDKKVLFLASCIALIATAMSFAIRGDIMGDFETEFVRPHVSESGDGSAASLAEQDSHVKTRLGIIAGAAFFSFGLTILFGGPLVDLLGMGRLLRLAAACHIGGTILTIFAAKFAFIAPSFWIIVAATLIIGAGNGLVEAVCNPLIATLYPTEKGHKLTIFHAWFPGGIVIGGVLAFIFTQIGLNWQVKMALLLIPSVVYAVMIWSQKFPPTERAAAGVKFSEMFVEAATRPLFLLILLMMWFTAATELGPGQWVANIFNETIGGAAKAGILLLVWGNGLMYILRQFFSKPAHSISPVALIALTAPLAAAGLFLFGYAQTTAMAFFCAALLYVGVAFWWPTMLGITTERCPRTGALGLAIIGGVGSFSTSLAGPVMGWINDRFGADRVLQIWSILPVIITVVFVILYLRDKAKGGYKVEVLQAAPEHSEAA